MIIVDVETTGTNPKYHSILSIGALDFNNRERPVFFEECKAFDGAKIEKEATAINGVTEEEALDPRKKTEKEIVKAFWDWAKQSSDHTVGGQNPQFDVSFILAGAERNHLDISLPKRIIDLHSICYAHMILKGQTPPVSNYRTDINSDFVMKYVGIIPEPKPHVAINGARYEAEAFSRLLYNKPYFEEFEKYKIPWI